ncbi:folate-binding protein YgfZ [Labrenzia sp. PHM005]|uniref:CAF17-like 4Fe-4S cluster assembly/insertion protein YgfZ n=1 Tax=Labrenzia sp. PHM005 TaxID=2590016 RepID=UPI001FFD28E3|nr:folate-binding protein YgfZ [Labrenzia sp. PHM005]
MTAPFIARLDDRSLIRVSGPEAQHFLQNLVTADIDELEAPGATLSALLTPQGKILFDFLIYKTEDGYLIDAPNETSADLLKRLTFYRLRAKVDLVAVDPQKSVFAIWGGEVTAPEGADFLVTDPRVAALGQRLIGGANLIETSGATKADLSAYDAHRISLGVPEGLKDFDYSDIFPHDADLDQLGGVSFKKGCYVGQEVVSRVQHRGTARKRFIQAKSASALPEKGTAVMAGGKSVGEIGSSTTIAGEGRALAIVRLDKVHQAIENGLPLTCDDVAVSVSLPDWADFGWPEPSAAD